MPQLRYLTSAKADLLAILTYISQESGDVEAGRRFVTLIRAKCGHLAALPGRLGRPRPELRPDIRSFSFRGYVIFFRYTDDLLEVVNILEGHRDVDQHFADPE